MRLKCTLCPHKTFTKMDHARRHLLDQHSMLGYMCPVCQRTFNRPYANYEGCHNGIKPANLILYCRQNGKQAAEASVLLEAFYRRIPSLIVKEPEEFPKFPQPVSNQDITPVKRPRTCSDLQDILEDLPVELSFLIEGDVEAESQYVQVPADEPSRTIASDPVEPILDARVTLDIGGTKFDTCRETLTVVSGSFFTDMILPNISNYFVDRDSTHFRTILNILRYGGKIKTVLLPVNIRDLVELEMEADFYRLYNLGVKIREKLDILC